MSSIGTLLLVHVFPALLPPVQEDEEYYQILGISSRNVSSADIRKAYRQKSLELHPDKVQQKGHVDSAQAARVYEKVQEAYAVLQDKDKRQEYHALGCSPARYRFVHQGGLANPVAMMDNLAKASPFDKTRLVLVVAVLLAMLLLQPILIAAKLNAILEKDGSLKDTKWILILIPTEVLLALTCLFWLGLLFVVSTTVRLSVLLSLFENACWLAGIVLLAQQWDRDRHTNWHKLSIPFYLVIFFKLWSAGLTVTRYRAEQEKMVSPEYLQTHEGNVEQMTEEEREALEEKYNVVTVDSEAVAAILENLRGKNVEINDQVLEELRVQTSPEYELIEEGIRDATKGLGSWLLYGVTIIALIAAKLQNQIVASWWVVFLPIWIHLGTKFFTSFTVCCCTGVSDRSGIIVMSGDDGENNEEETGQNADEEMGTIKQAKDNDDDAKYGENVNAKVNSSVVYADSEGVMNEFNESLKPTNTASNAPINQDSQVLDAPSDEEATRTTENKNGESEEHIDEEAFRAWQSAHAAEEKQAMEAASKAQGTCLASSFQIVTVCLIVAKLEDAYKSSDGDNGFDTFWILFPAFFVTGIVLCCCSLLIYGSGESFLEQLKPPQQTETAAASTAAQANEVFVPSPPVTETTVPEPVVESKTEALSSESSKNGKQSKVQDEEKNDEKGDMNDLD